MIRFIASDIDGTLVKDGGSQLNPELFQVITKLKEKGIQFAAATGRQWISIEHIFSPIKEKVFYLSDNGAYVGLHGRNLFLNAISKSLAHRLLDDIRQAGLDFVVSGADVVYMESKNQELLDWLVHGYRYHVVQVEDLSKVEEEFIKISIYSKKDLEAKTGFFQEKYGDKLKISAAGDMWLDFMKKGVSKGQAIQLLQESLGIKPEETMAFGDQLNDIEMLGQAYYSFAVGNAREEVKRAARFQADANVKDGVLKILKLLV